MSYFANIGFRDGVTDPFGRLRTSSPFTVLDLKQLRNSLPLFFSDVEYSGAGTGSVYQTNQAATRLSVTASTAGKRVRQSKLRGIYQTGKGLLIESTFNFEGAAEGIIKEAGYFDEKNGIGLRVNGLVVESFIRSFYTGTAVDNSVAQADWNIDKFDGFGPSGLVLDLTKAQIGGIDMQWLGVGRVRVALNINGKQYYFHQYNHANIGDGVYMSNPNLPIRYGIENTGTGTENLTMSCICASIVSEGGQDEVVQSTHVDRDITPATFAAAGLFTPLISIRLQSDAQGVRVKPFKVSVFASDPNSYVWRLFLNPTIAGVDAASWQSVANSGIDYDVSRTNANVITGGYIVDGDYGSSTAQARSVVSEDITSFLTLGFDAFNVSDQFVLAAAKLTGGAGGSVLGSVTVGEFA